MRYDDEFLVSACLNGDEEAFSFLVHRYKDLVHAYAYQKVRNLTDAEDIAQETFLKAYRNLAQLRWPHRFSSWLYTIVHNECQTWIRKHRRQVQFVVLKDITESHVAYEPSYAAAPTDAAVDVAEALARLSETHRTVASLYYLSDCSLKEIGAFRGISVNTAKVRLHRARKELTSLLGDRWATRWKGQRLRASFLAQTMQRVCEASLPVVPAPNHQAPSHGLPTSAVFGVLLMTILAGFSTTPSIQPIADSGTYPGEMASAMQVVWLGELGRDLSEANATVASTRTPEPEPAPEGGTVLTPDAQRLVEALKTSDAQFATGQTSSTYWRFEPTIQEGSQAWREHFRRLDVPLLPTGMRLTLPPTKVRVEAGQCEQACDQGKVY